MIWGAAQAALFSFPSQSQAGEWENYKDLKEALVRSSARRDVPLPFWASALEYKRENQFYDLPTIKNPSPAIPSVPVDKRPGRNDPGFDGSVSRRLEPQEH